MVVADPRRDGLVEERRADRPVGLAIEAPQKLLGVEKAALGQHVRTQEFERWKLLVRSPRPTLNLGAEYRSATASSVTTRARSRRSRVVTASSSGATTIQRPHIR